MAVAVVAASAGLCRSQEYLTGIEWPKPPIVTPGVPSTIRAPGRPPSDAVVLFDGKDFSAWNGAETWKIEDGTAVVGRNYIETKEHFGDSQLHVEWSAPTPPKGTSQGRGNSGVFFGPYELQVLDSYDNETYYDGQAGAIYKQQPPMVNVMRPPGEWNVYDILWTAPRFNDDDTLKSPAFITVLHNGVVVQNHFQLLGDTPFHRPPQYNPPTELPVRLQDHGNPVRFRNIWIRPIKPIEGKRTREPFMRIGDKEVPIPALAAGADVAGELYLDGKPLGDAKVTLFSQGGGKTFSADVAEGKFELKNVDPGTYAVSFEPTDESAAAASIPARYRDRDQSGLTVTIEKGRNQLQVELTSK